MSEWFLIGIPKIGSWRNTSPDRGQCAKDLKPRNDEETKSAWAHGVNEALTPRLPLYAMAWAGRRGRLVGVAVCEMLRRVRPMATMELHALALLLLRKKNSEGAALSRVWVLSLNRAKLDPRLVDEDPNEHVVSAYDWTHRGLATKDDAVRAKATDLVIEAGYHRAFEVHDYTLDELKPLLKQLVSGNLLRDEYIPIARDILGQDGGG